MSPRGEGGPNIDRPDKPEPKPKPSKPAKPKKKAAKPPPSKDEVYSMALALAAQHNIKVKGKTKKEKAKRVGKELLKKLGPIGKVLSFLESLRQAYEFGKEIVQTVKKATEKEPIGDDPATVEPRGSAKGGGGGPGRVKQDRQDG